MRIVDNAAYTALPKLTNYTAVSGVPFIVKALHSLDGLTMMVSCKLMLYYMTAIYRYINIKWQKLPPMQKR